MMSSFMLLVLLLAATAATVDCLSAIPGCPAVCGGVEIPYPFGIGSTCSRKGFEINCINNGSAGEIPVLPATDQNIPVLQLSVSPFPEARVLLPVAWRCFNSTGDVTGIYDGDVNFNPDGVYRISNTENELFVLSCNTYAYSNGVRVYNDTFSYKYYTGCITVTNDKTDPHDGACAGLGCCHVDIPPGITDTSMSFSSSWSRADQEFCPCDYAFIVEKGNYTFKASDLLTTHIPNNQTMPLSVNWTMPLRLDWAIRDNDSTTFITCAQAPNNPDHEYACLSNHSACFDSANGPGYSCNCTQGYHGNPYIVAGCTNINECLYQDLYHCPSGSKCVDTDGGYKCQCKFGRRGKKCGPLIPMEAVALIAIFVAIVLGCLAIVLLQKLKNRKRFIKNGGKILEKDHIRIYTKSELSKITKGYKTLLGRGYFGNVYAGTLTDDKKVAVKCPKGTKGWKKMEDEPFINEVKFQFSVRHENIVQLLGCCLETSIPRLVFEFVSNGSLDDALHSDSEPCTLSLPERLDIVIGSAEAIAYMHSLDNQKHVHGDIKPSNILLDEGLKPKVSDFGSSKLMPVDTYYVRAVDGDNSYVDPLYLVNKHYTLECDIYSFGMVLLELITAKTANYGDNGNKVLSLEFVRCFKDEDSRRTMYDEKIYSAGEDSEAQCNRQCLNRIGMLAVRCLNGEDRSERPTMADVVMELKQVKDSLL